MTNEEFLKVYRHVDTVAPIRWNSADVEREVARLTGLSLEEVAERVALNYPTDEDNEEIQYAGWGKPTTGRDDDEPAF